MRFTPKSDDELVKGTLLEIGDYDFEILDASEEISKKTGAEMLKLKLAIYQNGESVKTIFDYIMDSIAFKLKHFSQAVGIIDKYNNGDINAFDCIGRVGKCKIGIKIDKTGQYGPQNIILDYIPKVEDSQPDFDKIISGPDLDPLPY